MDKHTKNSEKMNNIFSRFVSKVTNLSKEKYNKSKLQEQIDKYEEMLDWMYGSNDVNLHTKDKQTNTNTTSNTK